MSTARRRAGLGLLFILLAAMLGWAGVKRYGEYQYLKQQADRQRDLLLEQRTANDIAVDNMELIEEAMQHYAYDHDWVFARNLEQLVQAGYLKEVPVNPFTNAPMQIIEFGVLPNAGEMSVIYGRTGTELNGVEQSEHEAVWMVFYADPDGEFTKYVEYQDRKLFWDRDDFLSEDIEQTVIGTSGEMTLHRHMGGGYSCWCDTIEDALIKNGYTLPVQVVSRGLAEDS